MSAATEPPTNPSPISYPPASILLIVGLGVLIGISAIASILESWADGRFFYFDFGILALPVAFGLLAKRHSSRRWALVFATVGALGSGIMFLVAVFSRASQPGIGPAVLYIGVATALALACIGMLCSAQSRAWFATGQSMTLNRWLIVFPILVPTAIVIIDGVVERRSLLKQRQALVDSAFFVDCRFDFFDAKTGNPIPASFSFTAESRLQGGEPAPKLSYSPQNNSFLVRGLAFAPYTLHAVADGYQSTDFTITPRTRGTIEIRLSPLATP